MDNVWTFLSAIIWPLFFIVLIFRSKQIKELLGSIRKFKYGNIELELIGDSKEELLLSALQNQVHSFAWLEKNTKLKIEDVYTLMNKFPEYFIEAKIQIPGEAGWIPGVKLTQDGHELIEKEYSGSGSGSGSGFGSGSS